MLCSEPFEFAYGTLLLDEVLMIEIGAGTKDLCGRRCCIPE
jgi:hypothetical protein